MRAALAALMMPTGAVGYLGHEFGDALLVL